MRSSPYVSSAEIGIEIDATALLEVSELRDLQAVEHHLPADAPRAQRRRFPVVFFELDVMLAQINTHRAQRFQIKLLHIFRRRLQDDLQLHVLVQAVGIFPIAPVGRPARRLHIRDFVRLRPQHAQKGFRRHGARADFDIVRLLQDTSALRPKSLQSKDQFLKRQRIGLVWVKVSSLH